MALFAVRASLPSILPFYRQLNTFEPTSLRYYGSVSIAGGH